jgi:hypothetical protein
MTEAEKRRALVAYRLEQADEALRSADLNLGQAGCTTGSASGRTLTTARTSGAAPRTLPSR